MKFVSTRARGSAGQAAEVSFRQAIFTGLATDGGLYQPASWPDLSDLLPDLRRSAAEKAGGAADPGPTRFQAVAAELVRRLIGEELGDGGVEALVRRAFPFAPRLREVAPGLHLLELFHGPTCAFKDFGASFLACSMDELLKQDDRRAVILVATSGDTGGAVARAFHGKENLDVVILYPSGRVSPLQEKQLTTLGGNVTALEIRGSFDDCQRLVKQAFLEPGLRRALTLTSANSINLGRLLPQSFYYFLAWAELAAALPDDRQEIAFCVPSGNFGNLTAGVYAWKWGLPARLFVAATNANDIVPRYLESGIFSPRSSLPTLSNAMDVGNPSNFERLTAFFEGDSARMAALIRGHAVTDEQTLQTMREVYERYGLLLDPHTAVGWRAVQALRAEGSGTAADLRGLPVVVLATAHPGKFGQIVERAAGVPPEIPPALQSALRRPKESIVMDSRLETLVEFLLRRFA